jgi:hypothetical protein
MRWTDTIMNSVDWESLGTSIRQAREMQMFVTKLHHDLLPTGRRVHHRYQAYYEKSCPSCIHEDEDQAHLFQCPDTLWEEWQVQFVKSIGTTKCRSMRVCPNITKLLTQGIESFLFDTTFPAYYDDVPPRLRLLAEEQRDIGWHQLIRGYWSTRWERQQQTYRESNLEDDQENQPHSSCWVSSMQRHIWAEVRKLWIMRNEDRHGKEELMKTERQCDQFCRETEWLYNMKEQYLPGHQHSIFHSSYQAHVTIENMIHRFGGWIRLNKQTILASVQHQDQRMGRNTQAPNRRSTRASPSHRTSASLPRYRQLTLHSLLEQSIINQRQAQDPVLAAALQMEDQDETSTSASTTSADTECSYLSSSDESS